MKYWHLVLINVIIMASVFITTNGYGENGTLIFGSSMDLSGPIALDGKKYSQGLRAVFAEANRAGGVLGGYNVSIDIVDDGYQTSRTIDNMNAFAARDDIFGFAGVLGTGTSIVALPIAQAAKLPFATPFTGSRVVRKPYSPYAIHYKPSYEDEVAGMVSFLRKTRGVTKFSILYQNDGLGFAGLDGLQTALDRAFLPLTSKGSYEASTGDVTNAVADILSVETEAVIIVATLKPALRFIPAARTIKSDLIFMAISIVNPNGIADNLGAETANIYYTATVPFPTDTSRKIVRSYQAALAAYTSEEPSFFTLEAYICGRLILKGLEKMYEEEKESGVTGKVPIANIHPSKFVSVFASSVTLTVDDMILGPYGSDVCDDLEQKECGCNQGGRSIFFGKFKGTKLVPANFKFSFETCGYTSVAPSNHSTSSSSSVMRYTYFVLSFLMAALIAMFYVTSIVRLKKACTVIVHHTL
eukprot:TRINITY_DN36176_c0_g1_i4.p1 TRINITY_DN36176_c0_g1~~TRINITY_DN36176_c0_g1_i4.p1  ORF type:complete len:506 (+),score=121.72 TRINITY_DN36176_c0_g1_i4:108-1520(+)